jgi:hypothetical protein
MAYRSFDLRLIRFAIRLAVSIEPYRVVGPIRDGYLNQFPALACFLGTANVGRAEHRRAPFSHCFFSAA